MTASPHGSKQDDTGRRKLMTYGKSSRKRITSSVPTNETNPLANESLDKTKASAPKSQSQVNSGMVAKSAVSDRPVDENKFALRQNMPTSMKIRGKETSHDIKRPVATASDRSSSNQENKDWESTSSSQYDSTLKSTSGFSVSAQKRRASDAETSPIMPTASTMVAGTGRFDQDAQQAKPPHNNGDGERSLAPAKPRRPRLIDTLAAQKASSPEPALSPKPKVGVSSLSRLDPGCTTNTQRSMSDRDARLRQERQSRNTPKRRKVRYTYSQSRSYLGESQGSAGVVSGENDPLVLESLLSETSRAPSPDAFDFEDDDEDNTVNRTTIKSAHELRRAGAHNRFADEMEDLIFRIGSPNCDALTMRRNALLELAIKLEQRNFIDQFRNHAARDKIAQSIGAEKDTVCAVALAAILIIFLSSGPAPNLLRQLAEDQVGELVRRLLHLQEDVDHIAAQRTTNLSKSSRATLGHVEKILKNMQLWYGYGISTLSPRILGLRLLEILFRVSDTQQMGLVASVLESDLLSMAEQYVQSYAENPLAVVLLMSVFEAQSSARSVLNEKPQNTFQLASLAARVLPDILQKWPQPESELETRTLKLAINITNTEDGAAVFNRAVILDHLVICIEKGITFLHDVPDNRMSKENHDSLLLVLGVMINIMEHSSDARRSLTDASMDILTTLYSNSLELMTETDREGKPHMTVPFGYLSVILGYLALSEPAGSRLSAGIRVEGLRYLFRMIQQLITMFNNSGNDAQELEVLLNELRIKFRL